MVGSKGKARRVGLILSFFQKPRSKMDEVTEFEKLNVIAVAVFRRQPGEGWWRSTASGRAVPTSFLFTRRSPEAERRL